VLSGVRAPFIPNGTKRMWAGSFTSTYRGSNHDFSVNSFGVKNCVLVWWKVKKVKFSRYRPEQALGGSGRLGFRIFSTFGSMKVVRSSPLRTSRLYPQDFSWYSFLEAESIPGHMVPPVASEKIASDTTGDRSRDPPTSSAVPLVWWRDCDNIWVCSGVPILPWKCVSVRGAGCMGFISRVNSYKCLHSW
jgi:hypothetical protein